MSNNPYSQAADKYSKTAKETPDQRELEGQLLIKSANELQRLHDKWDEATSEDINNILTYNRKLWMLFFDTAISEEETRPHDLRNNIINLCHYIFRRTIDILAKPEKEKLPVLIDINRQIAAGLMTKPAKTETGAPSTPPTESSFTSTSI